MASTSLDEELHSRLRRIAQEEHRSPDSVLNDVVRQYAERSEARGDLLAEAEASWHDYRQNHLHLTAGETRDWLQRWRREAAAEPPDCHD